MAELSLKTRGELWLANWFRRFFVLRPRPLEHMASQHFHFYDIGARQPVALPESERIPPTIWAYWNGSEPPLLIQRCFANWRRFNPGFGIRIVDDENLDEYLPDIADRLRKMPVVRRSDWIRLELLCRYGGIWLDASTILTESLDWVLATQLETQAEFVGYYIEAYTVDHQCPVVENWFMAVPPHGRFIEAVRKEFVAEVLARDGHAYIEHLRHTGMYEKVRQRIDIPDYLSMHLAMQVVLQAGDSYRLCLGKAEAGPFLLHVLGNWDRTPLKIRLMFSHIEGTLPSLIKLRSPDRKRLDEYLQRGLYVKGSIADRFLGNG